MEFSYPYLFDVMVFIKEWGWHLFELLLLLLLLLFIYFLHVFVPQCYYVFRTFIGLWMIALYLLVCRGI